MTTRELKHAINELIDKAMLERMNIHDQRCLGREARIRELKELIREAQMEVCVGCPPGRHTDLCQRLFAVEQQSDFQASSQVTSDKKSERAKQI